MADSIARAMICNSPQSLRWFFHPALEAEVRAGGKAAARFSRAAIAGPTAMPFLLGAASGGQQSRNFECALIRRGRRKAGGAGSGKARQLDLAHDAVGFGKDFDDLLIVPDVVPAERTALAVP